MIHGEVYYCTARDTWKSILLYSPCCMGSQSFQMCCTTHDAWDLETTVQSLGHGRLIPLYNPWGMEHMYHHHCCTVHGKDILLHNPWSMGDIYFIFCCTAYDPWAKAHYVHCTVNHPWAVNSPSPMGCTMALLSMGHALYSALYSKCMAHESWAKCHFAWPMTHGK